jgi:hypothetical protein
MIRPHSYDDGMFAAVHSGTGISVQCQYCSGQAFRRSRLRAKDWKQLFLMRYPVRCLRCSQRQTVSFTVAGLSVPSHIKQRQARHEQQKLKQWTESMKNSLHPMSSQETTDGEGQPRVTERARQGQS